MGVCIVGDLWDQLHTYYQANPTETELLREAYRELHV